MTIYHLSVEKWQNINLLLLIEVRVETSKNGICRITKRQNAFGKISDLFGNYLE